MDRRELPGQADIITGALAERGDWLVASVEGRVAWALSVQPIAFRGRTLFVVPATREFYPGVAVRLAPGDIREAAERDVCAFLSALCWVEREGVAVRYWTRGTLPRPMGRPEHLVPIGRHEFHVPYLPDPADPRARIALALYREGQALNHPAYQFLSFFKVLNVRFERGAEIARWINAHLGHVSGDRARRVLEELSGEPDIGDYLYRSGRCAVAHAFGALLVDPDDPTDERRLARELPLIQALAELLIEREFGAESAHTVWWRHLYELAGFKEILRPEVVAWVRSGRTAAGGEAEVTFPPFRVSLWGRPPFAPLSAMEVTAIAPAPPRLGLRLRSASGVTELEFWLDFAEERLRFDLERGITVHDDGTAAAAIEEAEVLRFAAAYVANGILQVHRADTGALVSRKDAFIPRNVDPGATATLLKAKAAERLAEAQRRRTGGAAKPDPSGGAADG